MTEQTGDGKIIVLCGQKGGTGKSMASRNLAVYLTLKGGKVLLVDADPQKTSGFFVQERSEQHPELPSFDYTLVEDYNDLVNIRSVATSFDYIVVDIAGKLDNTFAVGLMCADLAVIPFDPSPDSINTIPQVIKTIRDVKTQEINPSLKTLCLVSKGFPSGNLNRITRDALHEANEDNLLTLMDVTINNRASLVYAISEGLAVFEAKNGDWKAKREMNRFCEQVVKHLDT